MNTYDIGDVVRLSSAFTQDDAPIDPTTVSLKVMNADGTSNTYTYAAGQLVKDSSGVYHYDIAPAARGTYRYRFFSTGIGTAAEEKWFQVRAQQVP